MLVFHCSPTFRWAASSAQPPHQIGQNNPRRLSAAQYAQSQYSCNQFRNCLAWGFHANLARSGQHNINMLHVSCGWSREKVLWRSTHGKRPWHPIGSEGREFPQGTCCVHDEPRALHPFISVKPKYLPETNIRTYQNKESVPRDTKGLTRFGLLVWSLLPNQPGHQINCKPIAFSSTYNQSCYMCCAHRHQHGLKMHRGTKLQDHGRPQASKNRGQQSVAKTN